jgi:hypothetical protein
MTFRNKLVEKNAIPLATPLPLEQRQRQRQRQQHQIPNPQTNQAHIGVPGVEGVSELLICYPVWASERNRTTL